MSLPISSPVLLCIGWFWTGLQTRKSGVPSQLVLQTPTGVLVNFSSLQIFCFLLCKEDCGIPSSPFWAWREIKWGTLCSQSSKLRSVAWELLFSTGKLWRPQLRIQYRKRASPAVLQLTGMYTTSILHLLWPANENWREMAAHQRGVQSLVPYCLNILTKCSLLFSGYWKEAIPTANF